MMMFESLIESIFMYGAEIWGWKEQEEVEKVQEKYLREVLGVDRERPGYIVREEWEIGGIGYESEKESGKIWRQNGWKEAKGRWIKVELSKRDKDTDKQERRERTKESRYNGITGSMRGVWQRKFRNTWGERVQKKEKWWRDVDVGTRREKTGIGWEGRKEGAECAMRRKRKLSTYGMDVAKWKREGEKGNKGRNAEWRYDWWKRYRRGGKG
jgi:hypothetical protein